MRPPTYLLPTPTPSQVDVHLFSYPEEVAGLDNDPEEAELGNTGYSHHRRPGAEEDTPGEEEHRPEVEGVAGSNLAITQ